MSDREIHTVPDEIREKVDTVYQRILELEVVSSILSRLDSELPANLKYHCKEHTDEVLYEALLYGVIEQLPDRELELLGIAAAYHDSGFLQSRLDNELIGANLASQAMEEAGGYTADEIQLVVQMILDTTVQITVSGPKQIPSETLSRYLLDADLSNLGRTDFLEKAMLKCEEAGLAEDLFSQKTLELVLSHEWHTDAAWELREEQKKKNTELLRQRLASMREDPNHTIYMGVSLHRLGFLSKLPMHLNSSLGTHEVISRVLENLTSTMHCEAATVFIIDKETQELTFWALEGESEDQLEGKKISKKKGIVGAAIENRESILVQDVQDDERFSGEVDAESSFTTRDLICVPLLIRGDETIGAVQVLNSITNHFVEEDLVFLEHVANQLAFAIENAQLYEELQEKTKELQRALDKN